MAQFAHDEPVDVCVIGTGAGGGNMTRQLCANAVKVVALEAGPRFDPHKDFLNNEWVMFSKTAWLDPVLGAGADQTGLPVWLVKGVGGTTIHWAGASLRLQPHEFKAKTTYGNIDGATLEDWPLTLDEMMPYYEKAEKFLGVTGRVQPAPIGNTNFLVMKKGADKLGLNAHPGTMAINATGPYDGRPQCMQCGFCFQGCTPKAKWSTLYEAIPKAEATGNLDLRPNAMVIRINTDPSGKVSSVTYAAPDGKLSEQHARVVVLAGNSIQTPRLLLNSASSQFPHGLANSSGQVGRNYMRHLTASTYGIFPKPVHAYKGITMMGIIEDYASNKPVARGFAGGFHFETIMLGPAFLSVFCTPGPDTSTPDARAAWGEPLKNLMENYTHVAGMWIVGEDLPTPGRHVSLHPTQKDKYGMPVPLVTVNDHPNDKQMREFAWARGRDIFEAAGAVKTYDTPPYPATHNLGTCRMGANPSTSVVNSHGQCHDVKNLFVADGSVFTTSAAENPTLTISALAIRQADYIMDQMKKRAL